PVVGQVRMQNAGCTRLSTIDLPTLQSASASGGTVASGDGASDSRLMSSFSSFPGLKYGTFFGGTSTLSPVLGFRPFRGSRLRRRKLPNPRSSIFSPRCNASMMLLNTVSTMTSECFLVRSDTRDTSSTSSAFVMLPPVITAPTQRDRGPGIGGVPETPGRHPAP